ncbi:hypothetical protein [Lactiplantibacillus plantarum]
MRHYTNAFLKARNIQPAQVMVIHSNQIIADLLAHGIGQTIISRHVLSNEIPIEQLSAHYQRQFFLLTNTQPAAALRPVQTAITQYLTTWSD